jgi:hypothetical protein
VLKLRPVTFHSTSLENIYASYRLVELNRRLEIALGYYFANGTKYVLNLPDYGRNYYSEQTFETSFPQQEFPTDFPKEDYWRNKVPHMDED